MPTSRLPVCPGWDVGFGAEGCNASLFKSTLQRDSLRPSLLDSKRDEDLQGWVGGGELADTERELEGHMPREGCVDRCWAQEGNMPKEGCVDRCSHWRARWRKMGPIPPEGLAPLGFLGTRARPLSCALPSVLTMMTLFVSVWETYTPPPVTRRKHSRRTSPSSTLQ